MCASKVYDGTWILKRECRVRERSLRIGEGDRHQEWHISTGSVKKVFLAYRDQGVAHLHKKG